MCTGRIEDKIQIPRTATVMQLDTKRSITFMYKYGIYLASQIFTFNTNHAKQVHGIKLRTLFFSTHQIILAVAINQIIYCITFTLFYILDIAKSQTNTVFLRKRKPVIPVKSFVINIIIAILNVKKKYLNNMHTQSRQIDK